jgi:ribosomal 50S subunit-associated protein YjgA (DUF615 family)
MKRKLYSTDALPEADPHSRANMRRERQKEEAALLELAGQLVLLEEMDVDRLDLPEEVRDAVATARSCRLGKPRARALRLVRATLRGLEAELVTKIRQQLT